MPQIEWHDFEKIELRVGTVTDVVVNEKARVPAYILTIDLGPFGLKQSSAQLTHNYTIEDLIGKQVLCVCNLEAKRIAGIKSEVLVTGVKDAQGGVVVSRFDFVVPNGNKLL